MLHTAAHPVNKAGNIPNLMVPLIIAGFVLAGLMFGALIDPIYGWAVLALGLCGCMLVGQPKRVVLGYWAWAGIMEVVLSVVGNPLVRFADELMVIAITGIAAMQYIVFRQRFPELRVLLRMAALLFLVVTLSTVLNWSPPKLAIHFVLSYLAFIPVFYLAYSCLRPTDVRFVVLLLVVMLFVQLTLNLGWLAGVNPLPNYWQGGIDFAIGSFSGQNSVAYLSILVATTMVALLRVFRDPFRRTLIFAVALLSLFQLYITYTNHAYFLLIVVFGLYYLLVAPQARHRWVMLVIMVGAGALTVALITLTPTLGEIGREQFSFYNARGLTQRWELAMQGPKGETFVRVVTTGHESAPLLPFIGAGPGNFLSSIGIINVVPLAKEFIGDYFLTYSGRMDYAGGSILQHAKTGYLAIYSELGLLGLMLFVGMHVYAMLRVVKAYRAGRYVEPGQILMAEIFVTMGVIYGLINALSEFFHFDFWYLTFWILAAAVWTPAKRSREEPTESEAAREPAPVEETRRGLAVRLRRPTLGPRTQPGTAPNTLPAGVGPPSKETP